MNGIKLFSLAAGLLASVAFAGACSSSGPSRLGVPSATSSTPTGTSSTSTSTRDRSLAYSRCMRAHGLPTFPDPGSDGRIGIQSHPGSELDPNSARFKAAQKACKSLEPPPPSKGDQTRQRAAALKYSQCMRDHGIKDFPDPNPQGGISVTASPGADLDPNNPLFKAAQKACQSLQPGGGAGGGTQTGSGS